MVGKPKFCKKKKKWHSEVDILKLVYMDFPLGSFFVALRNVWLGRVSSKYMNPVDLRNSLL